MAKLLMIQQIFAHFQNQLILIHGAIS